MRIPLLTIGLIIVLFSGFTNLDTFRIPQWPLGFALGVTFFLVYTRSAMFRRVAFGVGVVLLVTTAIGAGNGNMEADWRAFFNGMVFGIPLGVIVTTILYWPRSAAHVVNALRFDGFDRLAEWMTKYVPSECRGVLLPPHSNKTP